MADRFLVTSFATVVAQLRESVVLIHTAPKGPGAPGPTEVVRVAITEANEQFKELKLSRVLRSNGSVYSSVPLWLRFLKLQSFFVS
jgi:hypothetical protein